MFNYLIPGFLIMLGMLAAVSAGPSIFMFVGAALKAFFWGVLLAVAIVAVVMFKRRP